MSRSIEELIVKKVARSKGKPLSKRLPSVIRKEELSADTVDVLQHFGLEAP